MASINIYINDDLKEEMALVEANWSEVCRQAINLEITKSKTGETSYEPNNFEEGNWDYSSFEENFNNENVIIKPYIDHTNPKLRNTVKVASQWLEEIKRELAIARLDGNSLGEFFQGVRKIEVLKPGKPWKTGYLKINYHIDFYFQDDDATDTIEAEIINTINPQISSSVVTKIDTIEPIDQSLRFTELEHLGIVSVDLEPLPSDSKEIRMMYPELYTPLKKAIENCFCLSKSKFSTKQVKQWWKEWYDHQLLINSGDIDIESFLEDEDKREADISGYINSEYFELRTEFLKDLEGYCQELGFLHYDFVYFSSFIFDLVYFTKEQDFNDLDLDNFAQIDFINKDELPHKSGLYFVVEDTNIYAFGFTKNLYYHWENHKLNKKINSKNNIKILFIILDSNRYLHNMKNNLLHDYLQKVNLNDNPYLNN
ncbi:hypothetical protein GM3708_3373 [Geminocystis sp. NIES-3708]|uniref:hypothetical protein n=1 Tax=Geminocystis sp. NIES-3708 TaxID=1615909 RepID=UPI0005FC3D98|nr:hypothetical protein [Geminocystis sp. NIES-3708]BAQ62967.1 hypothetical protein GM3708_3373 [Geminocystis sp. NIES-3708]